MTAVEKPDGVDPVEPAGDRGRDGRGRDGESSPESGSSVARFRLIVASVIVTVWAVMYLRAVLDPGFSPPPELSAVMLATVAWLYGSAALKGRS